jgi:hypothetical protein
MMVIVRLSPGLANQMMEYAAGYSLAMKMKEELVLDISLCWKSQKGYLLDIFNIPDYKKIIYFPIDSEHMKYLDFYGIPEKLRERVVIYSKDGKNGTFKYVSLKQDLRTEHKEIYMCDYFFDRAKYYDKYWKKIKHNFTLKYSMREVEQFHILIKNKVSVGIHIRRGDMLLADWAVKMEDNYYKAAVVYIKKKLGKCIFCVFSDDIEYAKKIFGTGESIYYIHFLGYDDADIAEFVCLSLCDHRILSNSSTFGKFADELNGKSSRITLYQSSYFDSNTSLGRFNIKRFSWLYDKFYGKRLKLNSGKNDTIYKKRLEYILRANVTEYNCKRILNEICKISLNTYEMTKEDEKQLLYIKFNALVENGEYDNSLTVAYRIYEDYIDNEKFRKNLIKSLNAVGAYKEAKLEEKYNYDKKHFIIIPDVKTVASSQQYGLIEVGIALHHMGHKVSFILKPLENQGEEYYVKNNTILANRMGISLGCYQYLKKEILSEGVIEFYNKLPENDLFIITRDTDFCGQKFPGKNIKYIFPDYTDWRDAESRHGKRIPQENVEYLYNNSDIIVTMNEMQIKKNQKIIVWNDNDHKEDYWISDERWKFGDLHRISERTICMVEAIIEGINLKENH